MQLNEPAELKRGRPVRTVIYERPPISLNGLRLTQYSWASRLTQAVDARGEDRIVRISDWEKALTNPATGRQIVHQFTVMDPSGNEQIVSRESVLSLFAGDDDARTMISASMTLASQYMRLANLERLIAALEDAVAEVEALTPPDPVPGLSAPEGRGRWWTMGDPSNRVLVRTTDATQAGPFPGLPFERYGLLVENWQDSILERRGAPRARSRIRIGRDNRDDLVARIARQERKIGSLKPTSVRDGEPREGFSTVRSNDGWSPSKPVITAREDANQGAARSAERFAGWFSGSKVTGAQGEPMVLYHATASSFDSFVPGGETPKRSGRAIWMTPNKLEQPAAHNIRQVPGKPFHVYGNSSNMYSPGTNVMPVYASISRPLVIDNDTRQWAQEVFGGDVPFIITDDKLQAIREAGYNGVMYYDEKGALAEVLAFNPEQVKSAIANNGQWSPTNPVITAREGSGDNTTNETFSEWFDDSEIVDAPDAAERAPIGVRGERFKAWFGKSRITDQDGEPLKVFHGTSSHFTAFKVGKEGTFGAGIYFADAESDAAEAYGHITMPVYLSLNNPWTIDVAVDSPMSFSEDFDHPGIEALLTLPGGRKMLDDAKQDGRLHFGAELTETLKGLGYDGVVATYTDGSKEFVAFAPTQVKSATRNNGNWSPTSPDITQRQGAAAPDEKTAAFSTWFEGSKIVNKDGAPLKAYHGTHGVFSEFSSHKSAEVYRLDGAEIIKADYEQMGNGSESPEAFHFMALADVLQVGAERAIEMRKADAARLGYEVSEDHQRMLRDLARLQGGSLTRSFEPKETGAGFYFTADTRYGRISDTTGGLSSVVMPVYLSIKNPLRISASHIEWMGRAEHISDIKSAGYDGLIFSNDPLDLTRRGVQGATQIVAFHPSQIKSALTNTGEYSMTNPDITRREDGAADYAVQGRAPAGGAVGLNGEFYKGGSFLPSTERPKQSPIAKSKVGNRRMIEPGIWEAPPASDAQSIFAVYREFMALNGAMVSVHERPDAALKAYVHDDIPLARVMVAKAVDAYNNGLRWIHADRFEAAARNELEGVIRAPQIHAIQQRAAAMTAAPVSSGQEHAPAALTADSSRQALLTYYGRGVEAMESVGLLRLATDVSELPGSIQRGFRATTKSALVTEAGVFQSVIVTNRHRDESDVIASVMHEIGAHYRMPTILGARGYQRLIQDVRGMADDHPTVAKMAAEVSAYYPEHNPDTREYWSEVIARLAERPDLINPPVLDRALTRVKAWLYGRGFNGISLSMDDIGRIAAAGVRATIKDAANNRIHDAPFSIERREGGFAWMSEKAKRVADSLLKRGPAKYWRRIVLGLRADQALKDEAEATGVKLVDESSPDAVLTQEEVLQDITGAEMTDAAQSVGRTLLDGAAHAGQVAADVVSEIANSVLPREAAITESASFRAFFRNSVTLDRQGHPLVLYHGSHRAVAPEQFSGDRPVWASVKPELASLYAQSRDFDGEAVDGVVVPVFIRAERPFDGDALPSNATVEDFIDQIQAQSRISATCPSGERLKDICLELKALARREESGPWYGRHDFWQDTHIHFGVDGSALINEAFDIGGFDSFQYTERAGPPDALVTSLTFGARRPEQVKSALANTGAFNPRSPLITARESEVRPVLDRETQTTAPVAALDDGPSF